MNTTEEVQSFNTIFDNPDNIIQIMSGMRDIAPQKKDYILVDFVDFSFKKVKLTLDDKTGFDKSLNYLVFLYTKASILQLCKLKLYYIRLDLFLPIEDITRTIKIWISWVKYMPMSTAFSLLRMDISAIFSSIRN